MGRQVNLERPQELLDAIIAYLLGHGLTDLSLRPLAKAVGSSPRVLLYYFGSKEKLVITVLAEIRKRQHTAFGKIQAASFSGKCEAIWNTISAPASEPLFRLYFEAYGIALRQPRLYREFLQSTVEDWLVVVGDSLETDGYTRADARAFATIALAAFRGFMLDYCTTLDRARLDGAVRLWLRTLDAIPVPFAKN